MGSCPAFCLTPPLNKKGGILCHSSLKTVVSSANLCYLPPCSSGWGGLLLCNVWCPGNQLNPNRGFCRQGTKIQLGVLFCALAHFVFSALLFLDSLCGFWHLTSSYSQLVEAENLSQPEYNQHGFVLQEKYFQRDLKSVRDFHRVTSRAWTVLHT